MLISEKLAELGICVLDKENEVPVDYLGLVENDAPGSVASFIDSPGFCDRLSTNVEVCITTRECAGTLAGFGKGAVVVENPRIAFFRLHNYLAETEESYCQCRKATTIGQNCRISDKAEIAGSNVVIGDNVVIEDHVVIKENVTLEEGVRVRMGAVIGGADLEAKRDGREIFTVAHCGSTHIGRNTEIQEQAYITKGEYPYSVTKVGESCVIAARAWVGHNASVGDRTIVTLNSIIGGNTSVGSDVWIGLAATLKNRIRVGNHAKVDIGSVVLKDVPDYGEVYGNPARVVKAPLFTEAALRGVFN